MRMFCDQAAQLAGERIIVTIIAHHHEKTVRNGPFCVKSVSQLSSSLVAVWGLDTLEAGGSGAVRYCGLRADRLGLERPLVVWMGAVQAGATLGSRIEIPRPAAPPKLGGMLRKWQDMARLKVRNAIRHWSLALLLFEEQTGQLPL